MSFFERLLLAALLFAAILNIGNWRALAWLAAGLASYAVSTAYYRAGLPLHPFVAALCDATVCLLIYRFGGAKWELPLFLVFQLSVLINFVQITRGFPTYTYALSLELINWAALLIIIGAGTARLADVVVDQMGSGLDRGSHLHRLVSFIYAPAKIHTWWFTGGWFAPTQ